MSCPPHALPHADHPSAPHALPPTARPHAAVLSCARVRFAPKREKGKRGKKGDNSIDRDSLREGGYLHVFLLVPLLVYDATTGGAGYYTQWCLHSWNL
uniref:Uncharacterized protein n=2 Tax=Oryza sativa subsp. japonica TaxID=39947 RepID=Q6ASY5_ORYSJ|nr:hypothetical protein [Oryza sativa Japonica Group]ABF96307.1 hypothetical protein LOC_Os03g26850 [Oryza sativa Japonica Group]